MCAIYLSVIYLLSVFTLAQILLTSHNKKKERKKNRTSPILTSSVSITRSSELIRSENLSRFSQDYFYAGASACLLLLLDSDVCFAL